MKKISREELERLFTYDDDTGLLTRSVTTSSRSPKGKIVGTLTKRGYLNVSINKKTWQIHRLIFIMKGYDIEGMEVDHINHIATDNRWCNLRLVTHVDNKRNYPLNSTNTSGTCGVRWLKHKNKWQSRVKVFGKAYTKHSDTKEEAIAKIKTLKEQHGFHSNHGL